MYKKMVCLLVFAAFVWFIPQAALAKDTKRTAYVSPGRMHVKPSNAKISQDIAHYEVTELDDKVVITPAKIYGYLRMGGGQAISGPDCYANAAAYAAGALGLTRVPLGPIKVSRAITVEWIPGKDNAPEPSSGLDITFHHYTYVYAKSFGLSLGNAGPPVSVHADAETSSPGNSVKNGTMRFQFLLEFDSDTKTRTEPEFSSGKDTIYGLKSGWKGYITAQVEVNTFSWVYSVSEAEASASVTWDATCVGSGGK